MRFSFKLILVLLTASFLFSKNALADENFDISTRNTYLIPEEGSATVTQNITIVNKKEFIYTPSYSISFGFENIENIQVYNQAGSIPFNFSKENGSITLTVNFQNPPRGSGRTNNFTVKFKTDELIDKKGEVYEVIIPGISNPETFTQYDTEILVPSNFPQLKIIKPKVVLKDKDLVFNKEQTGTGGIVLIFGDIQHYKLDLRYNLSNPNLFPIVTEIALPPNTNYQEVLINKLSIEPEDVEIDKDGNWIASYTLLPREKKVINAEVLVKIFSEPREESLAHDKIKLYTGARKYWDVNDTEVINLANSLKTPDKIYEFVVNSLIYDYEKVTSNNARLGGKGALSNPDNSVCLEFADLFVTIARAAGIPARTVEGYAYTKNSRLRPLSLVADVLHAWAEYYDFGKKRWIMVDPTWGNTTHGADYFNSLDLDHITFVIKGEESGYPIPAGGYKFEESSKDINVSFLEADKFVSKSKVSIDTNFPSFTLPGFSITGLVSIKNTGNTFIENKEIIITNESTGQEKEYTIWSLPPFGEEEFKVVFDTPILTNSKQTIKIRVDSIEKEDSVLITLIPNLSFILIGGGIFAATALVTWTSYKTWSLHIQKRRKKDNIHR